VIDLGLNPYLREPMWAQCGTYGPCGPNVGWTMVLFPDRSFFSTHYLSKNMSSVCFAGMTTS